MSLASPEEFIEGKTYRIVTGAGQGEQGTLIGVAADDLGNTWGIVVTPTGSYYKEYKEVALGSPPS